MLGGIYPGQMYPAGVPLLSDEERELQDGPWKPTDFSRGYPEMAAGWKRKREDDDLSLLLRRR